jgi:predicted RNA-binding Zn ribbon-like protein
MIDRWDNTPEGQHTFELALAFRTVLREMVKGIIEGKPVQPAMVAEINKRLRARIHYSQLIQEQESFDLRSCLAFDEAVHLLTPMAEAAGDLLRNTDFSLIKKCENPACILYFYDTTKNRARRWCSKHLCGNRMKVAAYYRRHRHKGGN